ncbi:hypothetical protein [Phenylobacterium sp.]|uniref:hypothetical protein n=1 Tax=Phenylobacterium sp. TaxID=1871053 RepID=UPI002CBFADBB|nr:hypothetical protein [Phenylobacterium sp.]HLZ74188.1 hypothetical protein [Phenylobacterium sp.]
MTRRFGLRALAAMTALTALTVLAAGAPGAKASAPATDPKATAANLAGVTVVAKKPPPVISNASEFVRQRMPESPSTGQYARFREPICVAVQGMPDSFNSFIRERIIKLAREVNAPVSTFWACTPNVQVIFTDQPQRLLTNIGRKREEVLGFHYQAQFKKLTTFDRPIQSWYVTRTRDPRGRNYLDFAHAGLQGDIAPRTAMFGGGSVLGGDSLHGTAGSRLGAELSSDIAFALIIGDRNKVSNAKIGPVADYIAFLALARWQGLERCNSVILTILNLMADACQEDPPETVTAYDLNLLKALYLVNPRESGSQQRMEIADRIVKAAAEAETAAR